MTHTAIAASLVVLISLGCGSSVPAVATVEADPIPVVEQGPRMIPSERRVYRLGASSVDGALASLGECFRVDPTRVGASASEPGAEAERAFDGDLVGGWNAGGFPPHSLSAELEPGTRLSGVLFVPNMTPRTAPVTHEVRTTPTDCERCPPPVALRVELSDAAVYALFFPGGANVAELSIRTTRSPSWVAWREVVPFVCESEIGVSGRALPVAPDPGETGFTSVPGTGSCERDSDCHPARACQAATCSDQPLPDGVAMCPASVGPLEYEGTGCYCDEGTCAAVVQG